MKTGKVYRGEPEKNIKADTTLTIDDSDMIDLVSSSFVLLLYYNKLLSLIIIIFFIKFDLGSWKAESSNGLYER